MSTEPLNAPDNQAVCPLCGEREIGYYHRDRRRDYWQCQTCQLVFVPPAQRLDAEAEKAQYDLHNNDAEDEGYRRFLNRLCAPLSQRLKEAAIDGAQGLDFGSGPGPTLHRMMIERGFECEHYDVFYHPDDCVFDKRYHFMTSTEVVEHLYHPGEVLNRLWDLLLPEGYLGLMTKRVIDLNAFKTWHYKNDPTHVCFFSEATFHWLAQQWHAEYELIDKDVVIFKKK